MEIEVFPPPPPVYSIYINRWVSTFFGCLCNVIIYSLCRHRFSFCILTSSLPSIWDEILPEWRQKHVHKNPMETNTKRKKKSFRQNENVRNKKKALKIISEWIKKLLLTNLLYLLRHIKNMLLSSGCYGFLPWTWVLGEKPGLAQVTK